MSKRKSRRHGKYWLLLMVIIALILMSRFNLFTIRHIECYTQFGTCPDYFRDQVSWINHRSLIRPLPRKTVMQSLAKFHEVKKVTLYRRLPSTLVLSVEVRRAIGSVGPDVLGVSAIADENGYVFDQKTTTILPYLQVSELPVLSTTLGSEYTRALSVMSLLAPFSTFRLTGSLSQNILSVQLFPRTKVILDINNPPAKWLSPLQFILTRSKIMAEMPQQIDLRFTDPVIIN